MSVDRKVRRDPDYERKMQEELERSRLERERYSASPEYQLERTGRSDPEPPTPHSVVTSR